MSNCKSTPVNFTIWVLIFIGLWLRLGYFDLMEFKTDEVAAIWGARYWAQTGVPRFGLMSGAGVVNPPGFFFLLAPLARFTISPIGFGLYIVIFNVAALYLAWRLGKELAAPAAGFWACGFLAAHPWLILYSRKIWAQSVLPFFVLLFLFVIARCERPGKSRAIFWAGPLVSLTWQIHYSGYCLLIFFLIWFVVAALRRRVNWPFALAGFAVGLLLLLPYLSYLRQTGFEDIRRTLGGWELGPEPLIRLATICRSWIRLTFAGGFGYPFTAGMDSLSATPLGRESPWLEPLALISTVLVLLLIPVGILARPKRAAAFPLWLLLFALLPVLLYFSRRIDSPPHYFIIALPAALLLAGLGMERLLVWCLPPPQLESGNGSPRLVRGGIFTLLRGALTVVLPLVGMAVIFSGVAIWSSFIRFIDRNGGTGGDYGLSYRVQHAASRRLIEERVAPGRIDAELTRDSSIGIQFLLRQASYPVVESRRARLIDTLIFPGRDCSPARSETAAFDIGPLKICLAEPGEDKGMGEREDVQ